MAILVSGLLLGGCDKEGEAGPSGLGLFGASSEEMVDEGVPVTGEDLERVARRGKVLGFEEHIFAEAMSEGMGRVGNSRYAALLPMASVDAGFNSGQITIFRWHERDIGRNGEILPQGAHKWLVIPVLLRPTQVLENEQFDVQVPANSELSAKVEGIMVATLHAKERYPDAQWNPHAFPELGRDDKDRPRGQTRVYLMAAAPGAPDLEVLVADARKNKSAARVVSTTVHHEDGLATPLVTALPRPGAMTVARVIAQRKVATKVEVRTASGERWTVHSETGELAPVSTGSSEG